MRIQYFGAAVQLYMVILSHNTAGVVANEATAKYIVHHKVGVPFLFTPQEPSSLARSAMCAHGHNQVSFLLLQRDAPPKTDLILLPVLARSGALLTSNRATQKNTTRSRFKARRWYINLDPARSYLFLLCPRPPSRQVPRPQRVLLCGCAQLL